MKTPIWLWVMVFMLILLPRAFSLDIETNKLSYETNEIIRVHITENSKIEYNNQIKYGENVWFRANKLANKIIVNDKYEKLVYVSDGDTLDTIWDLGIFGGINLFIFKVIRKCWKNFI